MTNRRSFLKRASALTLGALFMDGMASKANAAEKNVMAGGPIGLQTYSLGRELSADVPAGLKKIKESGYSYLELAGYRNGNIGQISMADYKKMANDAGLEIISSHLNPTTRDYSRSNFEEIKDFWKKATEDHVKLGVKYMVQPGLPNCNKEEDAQFVGEVFNAAGEITKQAGIQFGYHNHNFEFNRLLPGGTEAISFANRNYRPPQGQPMPKTTEEIFIESTDPSKVIFELDVYWTVMGGQDPVEWINKYADRIQMLHIKDRLILGDSGMMNFEKIFQAFYSRPNRQYFFVEIEDTNSGIQFSRIKASADYLNSRGFVK
ncbi:MAG: sugar phosphate isomerase/epimerase [Bacteroidaceae bacterium]|nr:sugar phosphate isomerase/epimerase [Bacteroidaceae bacterium]